MSIHSNRRNSPRRRKGAVAVLSAFILVFSMALVAMALDLGYLMMAKSELQRNADSTAMAACWELIDDEALKGSPSLTDEIISARVKATAYGALNKVCNQAPSVDGNASNSAGGDVVIGYISNPTDPSSEMTFTNANKFNAVNVLVSRNAQHNGLVPTFFGKVLGVNGFEAKAEATAALINDIKGFKSPGNGENLEILPFALDEDTWNGLLAGGGTDSWTYNPTTKAVSSGGDGIKEVNLFPQGTGSPGNRGTIDIGGENNSTAVIASQIVNGISASDMQTHESLRGPLVLNSSGELFLNGDTGISAGVKDELASIKGKPRIVPIFRSVTGPGNNAEYKIVKFVGVRIVDVKLTGSMSSKKVMIQPAQVVTLGGQAGTSGTSNYVYSPVWLIR